MERNELAQVIAQVMPVKRGNGTFHAIVVMGGTGYLGTLEARQGIETKAIPIMGNYKLLIAERKTGLTKWEREIKGAEKLRVFEGTFLKVLDSMQERNIIVSGVRMKKDDLSEINITYKDGRAIGIDEIYNNRNSGYRIESLSFRKGESTVTLHKNFAIDSHGSINECSGLIADMALNTLSFSAEAYESIKKCSMRNEPGRFARIHPITFQVSGIERQRLN